MCGEGACDLEKGRTATRTGCITMSMSGNFLDSIKARDNPDEIFYYILRAELNSTISGGAPDKNYVLLGDYLWYMLDHSPARLSLFEGVGKQ